MKKLKDVFVIGRESDATLLGGTDEDGQAVSFHLPVDEAEQAMRKPGGRDDEYAEMIGELLVQDSVKLEPPRGVAMASIRSARVPKGMQKAKKEKDKE